MTNARLHAIEAGPQSAAPVVLLHGFGGHGQSWQPVLDVLAGQCRTIAFDLPGHGGSLDYPGFGSPRTAALAVLAELRLGGIDKAHIAGHSMGGAAAVLLALADPEAIASLTLIAPGGFGPEMDGQALRSFAEAGSAEDLSRAYAAMMAPRAAPEPAMIERLLEVHIRTGQKEALRQILARISRGQGQGELPLGAMAKGRFPVTLIWGTEDRIVPFAQAANAPDWFSRVNLPGKGHMLLDEAPDAVANAICTNLQDSPQTI